MVNLGLVLIQVSFPWFKINDGLQSSSLIAYHDIENHVYISENFVKVLLDCLNMEKNAEMESFNFTSFSFEMTQAVAEA